MLVFVLFVFTLEFAICVATFRLTISAVILAVLTFVLVPCAVAFALAARSLGGNRGHANSEY